jgi:hypothetical protein
MDTVTWAGAGRCPAVAAGPMCSGSFPAGTDPLDGPASWAGVSAAAGEPVESVTVVVAAAGHEVGDGCQAGMAGTLAAGSLWEITSTSTGWAAFTNLGGTWPFDPGVNVGSSGYVKLLEVGATTALSTKQLAPGGTWPSAWTTIGGTVTGDPAVVQDHGNTTRVYVRDSATAAMDEFYSAGGTTTWAEDGQSGAWPSDAAASVGGGGYLKVFAVGTSANMYQNQLPPGGVWSSWADISGSLNGVPSTVQQTTNGTNWVFARGSAGTLEAASEPSTSSTWSAFTSLGGAISS